MKKERARENVTEVLKNRRRTGDGGIGLFELANLASKIPLPAPRWRRVTEKVLDTLGVTIGPCYQRVRMGTGVRVLDQLEEAGLVDASWVDEDGIIGRRQRLYRWINDIELEDRGIKCPKSPAECGLGNVAVSSQGAVWYGGSCGDCGKFQQGNFIGNMTSNIVVDGVVIPSPNSNPAVLEAVEAGVEIRPIS